MEVMTQTSTLRQTLKARSLKRVGWLAGISVYSLFILILTESPETSFTSSWCILCRSHVQCEVMVQHYKSLHKSVGEQAELSSAKPSFRQNPCSIFHVLFDN